jgi:4,5-dihydroxyphthalate decarboxylase
VARLKLTVGISSYDHVRDLFTREYMPEGLSLRQLDLPVEELFYRFITWREWEVSEISFGKFVAMRAAGDESLVGIPVFPSRVFRHSAMFVRADSPLEHPSELRGLRIGIPEWVQTAGIYMRGTLADEFGVGLTEVRWVQAGVNQAGRVEKVKLNLPDGVQYSSRPDASLAELLVKGEIDAVFSAHPPDGTSGPEPAIRPLFRDPHAAELASWREHGVYPIMHTVAIRRDVIDRNPWVARSLFKGFELAKQRSIARLHSRTISYFPVPWISEHAADFVPDGADPWPYHVEPNRRVLETFLRNCGEQGLLPAPLAPEDLFWPGIDSGYRV